MFRYRQLFYAFRLLGLMVLLFLALTLACDDGVEVTPTKEPPTEEPTEQPVEQSAEQLVPGGFRGIVSDRDSGAKIPGALIVFESEDGTIRQEITSDANGGYGIELLEGRYWVTASHDDYQTYTSRPGFFVVIASVMQAGNIILESNLPPDTTSPGGYQGIVMDSASGAKISGVLIVFESEDGAIRREVRSDANGGYSIELPQARYWVTASHDNYHTYSTHPGFFVVPGPGFQTGNIDLEPKQVSSDQQVSPGQTGGCSLGAGGYCWYFGADSASCDDVCASHGGYHEATRSYAGSDGSPSDCRGVLDSLGLAIDDFFETAQGGIGCFAIQNTSGNYFGYWDQHPTTSSATYGTPGRHRICACQQ